MLPSVFIWICMLFSFVSVVRSIPAGGSQSRPPRYLLGRNGQDLAAHLFDQVAQIVEQVIDLRVALSSHALASVDWA